MTMFGALAIAGVGVLRTVGISAGSEECKYSAAIQRGSMAYFVPSSAENIGAPHAPRAAPRAPHLCVECGARRPGHGVEELQNHSHWGRARANGNTVEERS